MFTIPGTHRRSSLYYVESIEQVNEPYNEPNRHDRQAIALLQYIPIDIHKWEMENRDFKWYTTMPVTELRAETFSEGNYVHLLRNNDFLNGGNDERARRIIDRSEYLFRIAEESIVNNPDFPAINNVSTLYSYHVNVGHGNLSLLVIESNGMIRLWMIDGSNFDFLNHRNHKKEIEHCLDHIYKKFKLSGNPHIDVLMITHAHYDHYSGITSFIRDGLINSHTLVYLNLKKKVHSHNFNNLLEALINHRMRIVQPFVQNRSTNIDILYPDISTFSSSLKLNNTSSVYSISFDGITYFVFPGDLETEGWDLMDSRRCRKFMKLPKYYAISHHGSLNGHLRNPKCKFRHTESIAECLHPYTKTVLMGRNHAFNGIYSECVLNDFNGRLYLSENDNLKNKTEFLEIDLLSGTETWH